MSKNKFSAITTEIAPPPGEKIKQVLDEKDLTQKEFAQRMALSEKHVSKLVNGEVQLTPGMAVKLESVLGIPASYWCGLESSFRESIARREEEEKMGDELIIARRFPCPDMERQGWISRAQSRPDSVYRLRQFFEVCSLSMLKDDELAPQVTPPSPDMNPGLSGRTSSLGKELCALLAWAQKAKLEARHAKVRAISLYCLEQYVSEIREQTVNPPHLFCPKLKKTLAESGVALVFMPAIRGAEARGAVFTDGRKLVLAITIRDTEAAVFWFNLFYEIACVLLQFAGRDEALSPDEEQQAVQYAWDVLIPPDAYAELVQMQSPDIETIRAFSSRIGVHPSIVCLRLYEDGLASAEMRGELAETYMPSGRF
ncbi:MAG: helix-turn-helix domain-containing protein [Desulfovibrionaceae bacterium]|nr:helix-turn-helix domain-containing protein [Desulfovibrionaceae bacterium]